VGCASGSICIVLLPSQIKQEKHIQKHHTKRNTIVKSKTDEHIFHKLTFRYALLPEHHRTKAWIQSILKCSFAILPSVLRYSTMIVFLKSVGYLGFFHYSSDFFAKKPHSTVEEDGRGHFNPSVILNI
jgi:hypothetical protein